MKVRRCAGPCREFFEDDGGRFCADCGPAAVAAEAKRRRHLTVDQSRMKAVREMARNDTTVVCFLCGNREAPEGYDPSWSADHVEAGKAGGPLAPAHLGCNSARGNKSVEWFRQHLKTRNI